MVNIFSSSLCSVNGQTEVRHLKTKQNNETKNKTKQ